MSWSGESTVKIWAQLDVWLLRKVFVVGGGWWQSRIESLHVLSTLDFGLGLGLWQQWPRLAGPDQWHNNMLNANEIIFVSEYLSKSWCEWNNLWMWSPAPAELLYIFLFQNYQLPTSSYCHADAFILHKNMAIFNSIVESGQKEPISKLCLTLKTK